MRRKQPKKRVAIDVGGTFTDCLVLDELGELMKFKASTTPKDPSDGFMHALEKAARHYQSDVRALSFKIGAYRPPSEGGCASLLLQVSENCPWNRCTYWEMYKGHRFVHRPIEEIKADIDTVAAGLRGLSIPAGEAAGAGTHPRGIGPRGIEARPCPGADDRAFPLN